MNGTEGISFSSFLAGALLSFGNVTNLELTNYMSSFESMYDISIYDDGIDNLSGIIGYNSDGFYLIKGYDDKYNDICTVKEYLYSMTSSEIRTFYGYNDRLNLNLSNVIAKKKGILKKLRTRVFHF